MRDSIKQKHRDVVDEVLGLFGQLGEHLGEQYRGKLLIYLCQWQA